MLRDVKGKHEAALEEDLAEEGTLVTKTGARAVDLGRPDVYYGGQSLKLSTKTAVFKRESLFIRGGQACRLEDPSPLSPPPGAGPADDKLVHLVVQSSSNPRK